LLRDVAQKDVLDGRGNVNLDVQDHGGSVTALKKSARRQRARGDEGWRHQGVNLADSARKREIGAGCQADEAGPSQKTDFSEMSASFKIAAACAQRRPEAASPFLRLAARATGYRQ